MDVRQYTFLMHLPSARMKAREHFLGMPKRGVAFLLANVMFWQPLWAQADGIVVSAPGTTLDHAGNGVQIINIATPNGSGLSHNQFVDYNVNSQGLILNNGASQTSATQLGGIIIGNPNLKNSGSAQIILNEVNGGNPSQLRGYTEVAGQSARVIVANPYGISCNGCGFINTPRITLTTGKPMLDGAGRLDRFQVDQGSVSIDGDGLDASNVDSFEIITRSARINADIHARKLTVIAGRNNVNATTLNTSARADDGSVKPQFAIDSSVLGGMYAGAIKLVGTEAGVGVKLAGNVAASGGDLQIDVNGHLNLAGATAVGAVNFKAASLENQGTVSAGSTINVLTAGDLTNQHTFVARDSIVMSAGGQLTNSGIIEAGVNADESRNAHGDVSLIAQNINNSGKTVVASRSLTVNATQTLNNQGGTLSTGQSANVSAMTLDNRNNGRVLSSGALSITADQVLNSKGMISSDGNFTGKIGQLSNEGGRLLAQSALSLDLNNGVLSNQLGVINSKDALSISHVRNLDNQNGVIASTSSLNVSGHTLDNRKGKLISNERLTVVAESLNNQGGLVSGWQGLSVAGGTLDNSQEGTLSSLQSNVDIDLSGALINNTKGGVAGKGEVTVTAASLDNRNGIVSSGGAQQISITQGAIDNSAQGLIESSGTLDLIASKLGNASGKISAQKALTFTGIDLDNTSGNLAGKDSVTLDLLGVLTNTDGVLASGGPLVIKRSEQIDNKGGKLISQQLMSLLTGQLNNDLQGIVAANAQLDLIATRGVSNTGNGLIHSSGAGLNITTDSINNSKGSLQSHDNLILKVQGGNLDNQGGKIIAKNGHLNIDAGNVDNRNGELSSLKDLMQTRLTGVLRNGQGGKIEGNRLDLQALGGIYNEGGRIAANAGDILLDTGATQLNNIDGGIYATELVSIKGNALDNSAGKISGKTIALELDGDLVNHDGLIESGSNLKLRADNVDNQRGQLRAMGVTGTTDFQIGRRFDNRNGLLETANTHLTLATPSFLNTGGNVTHVGTGDFNIATANVINAGGTMVTRGDMTLDADSWTNSSVIQANNLKVNVSHFAQTASGQLLASEHFEGRGENWTNDGLIASDGTLDVQLLKTYGGNGRMTSLGDMQLDAAAINVGSTGSIAGGNKTTVGGRDELTTLNNSGRLTAANQLIVTAKNVNNYGTLAGGSALKLKASTLLNDQGGLLFSGGDMALRVGSFTNRNSDVYSLGAIDIARDDAGGRAALVENLSGTMESGGDFSIRADSIVNRRDQFKTVSEMYTADIGVRCYDCEQLPANWADLSTHPIASHLVWEQTFKVSLLEGESSKAASMNSGRNLDVSGGAFRNSNSSVSAVGKIDIAVSDFENSGTSLGDFTSRKYLNGGQSIEQWQEIVNYNAQNDAEYNQDLRFWNASEADSRVLPKVVRPGVKGEEDNWSQRLGPLLISLNKKDNAVEFGDSQYSTGVRTDAPRFIKNAVFSETIINGVPTGYASAIIQAAGNVTVNAANQINNGVLSPYSSVAAGTSRNADTAATGTGTTTVISLNSQLSPDLAQQQINPLTLPGFSLPTGQNGLFRLNDQSGSVAGALPNGGINSSLAVTRVRGLPDNSVRSTSHKYLVETNPVLTDLKQFMSSDYLLTNLGYDPDISAKRLGDGFYEQRLIQQAIIERTGQRFIDGQTSDEGLFKYLMNNAIASKDALNLSVGVTLTSQQVAALTHDIVWLEEQQVNGEKVLVPVLYLAQAKNRLAPNGALIQGNDVKLIAGQDLNNAGTLRATNNLAAMAGLNLTNNGGLVEAGNRLDLLATNDVLNTLGGVIAGRDVSVTASNGDVINERTITALDSTLYGILHREFADNAARIEATNDLNVSASRDINLIGGALQSGRDLNLEATRDVNLASQQVSNSSYQSARHNSSDITQLSAEVSAGRDLSVEAGRDINVIASDVDAKGDIAMAAGENLTISSAADEEHSLSKNKKVTQQEDHVSQVMSAVTAGGDVALSAGNDLAVISSRITAGDEAYLVAGGRLDILAAQDSDYSLYDKKKKGSFGSLETRHDEVTDVNNIGSQISAGGDLTLVSGGDQLYQGAKLNSGKDLTLDSGGKITFEAVKDLHDESHTKSDSDSFWFSAKGEGRTDETLRQSQLTAGGDIVIRAIDGLQIDLKQIDQNTVRQSIEAMVKADSNLAWLEEAERRGDVDWRLVKEIHESFKYDDAGLGPASQLIIAIVASVLIGPLTGAIASNFAVGTVNGGGDLGAGFKAATSIDALKGYATQWATAYGLSTMDSLVGGWQAGGAQVLNGSGVSNPGYSSSLLDWNTAVDNVLRSGSHVLISGGINTAINGGSLKDNLAKALASEGLDFVAAFGNKQVGDLADYLNVDSGSASKILMHALLGGALSVASGGEFKTGALAGAAAEGLTQFTTDALGRFLDERIVTDDQFKVGTAQIIGILAAASGGGDPAIGSWVAGNAERYNQQVHREAKQRLESGFAILHERGEFVDLQPEDVLADLQKIAEGEKDRSQLNPKTVEFLNQFPPAALRDIFFELTDFERYVELGIDISFPTPSPVGKVKAVATISEAAAKEILQALEKKFGAALLEVEAKAARGAKGAGVVSEVPQITLNRQNGTAFERQVVDAFDHVGGVKNTTPVTVQLPNGAQVTTIPDLWGKNVGGLLEVKNVHNLSMSNQLRAQIKVASDTGQPLNLVVSPRTSNVSGELMRQVRSTGGDVFRYNPATGDLTRF